MESSVGAKKGDGVGEGVGLFDGSEVGWLVCILAGVSVTEVG